MVSRGCQEADTKTGPATVRTPYGLSVAKWEEGLSVYAKQAEALQMLDGEMNFIDFSKLDVKDLKIQFAFHVVIT